eukprot:IDg16846t1
MISTLPAAGQQTSFTRSNRINASHTRCRSGSANRSAPRPNNRPPTRAPAMNRAKHAVDGVSKNGDPIEAISLRGPDHMTATILPLGARLLDVRLANGPSL